LHRIPWLTNFVYDSKLSLQIHTSTNKVIRHYPSFNENKAIQMFVPPTVTSEVLEAGKSAPLANLDCKPYLYPSPVPTLLHLGLLQ